MTDFRVPSPVTHPIAAELHALGLHAAYRPGSSDERVLHAVTVLGEYRRKSISFDVEAGEMWLDLGANVGAFALYCVRKQATAECYEPDPACFNLLRQNVPAFTCHHAAVTASRDATRPFWVNANPTNHFRATTFAVHRAPLHPDGALPNLCGEFLRTRSFDGVKMDIEGSEGELLDAGYLPRCDKLVMEYHLSRDPSLVRLRARLAFLATRFELVHFAPELRRLVESPYAEGRTFYDQKIWCMHPK